MRDRCGAVRGAVLAAARSGRCASAGARRAARVAAQHRARRRVRSHRVRARLARAGAHPRPGARARTLETPRAHSCERTVREEAGKVTRLTNSLQCTVA